MVTRSWRQFGHNMDLNTPLEAALSTKREYILALKEMNLRTVEDLLLYFPRSYEDLSQSKNIMQVKDGEKVSMQGMIHNIKNIPTKKTTRIKIIFTIKFLLIKYLFVLGLNLSCIMSKLYLD